MSFYEKIVNSIDFRTGTIALSDALEIFSELASEQPIGIGEFQANILTELNKQHAIKHVSQQQKG